MRFSELQQIIGTELEEYKPKAGVYFLLKNEEIVYVGQSQDISRRLAEHKNEGVKEWDRVVFQVTNKLEDRLIRESHYIKACQPKYNAGVAEYVPFPHPKFDEPRPGQPLFVVEANVNGVRPEQLEQYLDKAVSV